jgi:hypothetical protein
LGAIGAGRLVEVKGGGATTTESTDPRTTRQRELAGMDKDALQAQAEGIDGAQDMGVRDLRKAILDREFPQE